MRDEDDDVFSAVFGDHKRLVAERFRRIWQLVEDIASSPGKSRKELANEFSLSERQVQADLNVIRREMSLPLVRRQGYRVLSDPPAGGPPVFPGGGATAADAAATSGTRPVAAGRSPAIVDGQAALPVSAALAAAGGQNPRGGIRLRARRTPAGDLRSTRGSAAAEIVRKVALSGGGSGLGDPGADRAA